MYVYSFARVNTLHGLHTDIHPVLSLSLSLNIEFPGCLFLFQLIVFYCNTQFRCLISKERKFMHACFLSIFLSMHHY